MTGFPSFAEFFFAVSGNEPLPWQERLASTVAESGWPANIGVPTGLGKTVCIDIAVWSMAREAPVAPPNRRLPTRVWYVVNRRILVDAAADRSELLAGWLDDPSSLRVASHARRLGTRLDAAVDAVAAVGAALDSRMTVGRSRSLHVCRLRGGYSERPLPATPSQPSIVHATVPMFGSRLLFRGYGGGRYARPVETALASVDSLVLLDEAHLARPLRTLVGQLAEADGATSEVLGGFRCAPIVVSLTATGESNSDRFDLDEADLQHRVVKQRLSAAKPTRLVPSSKKELEGDLVSALVEELAPRQPAAAVIFTNSAARALRISKLLEAALKKSSLDAEVTTLTGRLRASDADQVRARLLDQAEGLASGRDRSALRRHHVVVSTQTLEVGADLDFDVLITETAGARALVQRFGRLNRLGDTSDARAVIVHADDVVDLLYGEERASCWERLKAERDLNLSPSRIAQIVGEPADVGPRSPELLPNHLDEFAKTTLPPPGEAPVSVFFDGVGEPDLPTVEVAWREELPEVNSSGSVIEFPALEPRLGVGEVVDLPIGEARNFVSTRLGGMVHRLRGDRLSLEVIESGEVRPGDQLLLPSVSGGYARHGWDSESEETVPDLSWTTGGVLLRPKVVGNVLQQLPDIDSDTAVAVVAAIRALQGTNTDLAAARRRLEELSWSNHVERAIGIVAEAADLSDAGEPVDAALVSKVVTWLMELIPQCGTLRPMQLRGGGWVAVRSRERGSRWAEPADDAFDELSLMAEGVNLGPHLRSVGEIAAALAIDVGLADVHVDAVRRAGQLHDLGKSEPRFQRWLHDGAIHGQEDLVAKSSASATDWERRRVVAGWPRGGRHEALSVRIAKTAAADDRFVDLLGKDPDLVLHLVAAHHGRGRPGLRGVDDDGATRFIAPVGGLLGRPDDGSVEVYGGLTTHDWEQPARFERLNTRYGRRGLALLEAIVRQADWAASSASEKVPL